MPRETGGGGQGADRRSGGVGGGATGGTPNRDRHPHAHGGQGGDGRGEPARDEHGRKKQPKGATRDSGDRGGSSRSGDK